MSLIIKKRVIILVTSEWKLLLFYLYKSRVFFIFSSYPFYQILYILGKVSAQKKLRGGVIFVTEIPKNPSGKILRKNLKRELANYKSPFRSKLWTTSTQDIPRRFYYSTEKVALRGCFRCMEIFISVGFFSWSEWKSLFSWEGCFIMETKNKLMTVFVYV